MIRPSAEQLINLLDLQPLPVEGGLFKQTWRSPTSALTYGQTHPLGTATIAMLTDAPDSFSAMHRLPTDELWHFYLGDPIAILLIRTDGVIRRLTLGQDMLAGHCVQALIPAGTWMGARLQPGGSYGLFGNTMAPGFLEADYEGGDASLAQQYPEAAAEIFDLLRPGTGQLRMD
jgi:predicted cupin superfamily sugar epimerase